MGRLFHLGYMGRSPTVTGKEGSSKFAFTAKHKQRGRNARGLPKVSGKIQCSLWQRNAALPRRGLKTSHENKEGMFRAARNKTTSRISNSKISQSPPKKHVPFYPTESRFHALHLCCSSEFTCLCTIFPLASSNSSALLHILPCWPGIWARTTMAHWMQWWDLLPATAKES